MWSLSAIVCMPNIQDTSDASIGVWMLEQSALANVARCVKRLVCSDKLGKRYIRTTPFTIYKAAYLSGISTEIF